MAIFKRGGVYWYEFVFKGQRVRKSTKQADRKAARQVEAAYRTALAKGTVDLFEREAAPKLKEFAQRFMDHIQVRCAEKPRTVSFYAEKLARLLEFPHLADARLDSIDEAMIEKYVQDRRTRVAPATVNRQLATLRRALRLAQEWRVIDRVPRIRVLAGERNRDFVMTHEQQRLYLAVAPQPLHDVAVLLLDTGMRVGEALSLEWSDVHLEPVGSAKYGYLRVREGKSRHAKRNLSLTAGVSAMLEGRTARSDSPYVFPSEAGGTFRVTSLGHQHGAVKALLKAKGVLSLPADCVVHSLRHTMLSRLGEAGADAFSLMRIAGHSSVVVSQRYVHPSPESLERAFEKLEAMNQRTVGNLPVEGILLGVPTKSPHSWRLCL